MVADPTNSVGRRQWIYPVVFLSGFAGLGYEMVWTRVLALSLGHEIIAVLAVLAAFFAGLSLGAFALGGLIKQSSKPALWYAALEMAIGCWAIALIWLIPAFNEQMPQWIGESPGALRHWSVAFGATFILLLPATAAMGATLPSLEQSCTALFGPGRYVGGVYATNTLGAVAGTLLTTFAMAPALGFTATLWLCAAINIVCGLWAFGAWRSLQANHADQVEPNTFARTTSSRLLTSLFITGLLGLAFEVVVIRVLSQVLENTVFTFAAVLSVYLLGTAIGAWLYQRYAAAADADNTLQRLIVLTTVSCLIGSATLWASDALYTTLTGLLSRSATTTIGAEFMLAATAFLLPTIAMGGLFSHLAQTATPRFGLGRALAINTLGAAIAPLLAGIVVLPLVGAQFTLIAISLAYLLLLPRRSFRPIWLAAPVTAALLLALSPPLRFVDVPEGGKLLDYHEGVMASVAVVSDDYDTRYLKINNHFTMGSTSSGFADHRQTHIPLLLHPNPHSALYLGVGTGMTMNAAQYHPGLSVTAVELVPESLEVLDAFGTAADQNHWQKAPRLLASDARRFVVSTGASYDVIIADLFHPSRDGSGALYTREHFDAIQRRLNDDGIFCQWLPLFQMDLETFKIIARTFSDSFPHVQMYLPHNSINQPIVGLIGTKRPLPMHADYLVKRVSDHALQRQLVQLRLNSDFALYGGFVADRDVLLRYAGDTEPNTDDKPLVTYRAPAFAYRQTGQHGERLVELVEAVADRREAPIEADGDKFFGERLQAYWQARDAYLHAGLGVNASDDLQTMLAKIRNPLLDVVRISDDFWSAYEPLLAMAESLNQINPDAARQLLVELDKAAPSRSEARRLLATLQNN